MGKNKHNPIWWVLMVPVFIAVLFGLGYVVMRLWNWLIPELFSGPVLSYWQTVGLLVLVKLFVTPMRGGSHKSHCSKCEGKTKESWKQHFAQKYSCLDDEHKQKLRECLGDKFEESVAHNPTEIKRDQPQ